MSALSTSLVSNWERHEAKYIIPEDLVPQIREFVAPFTVRDPHGEGVYPEYEVVTLQFDGPGLPLYEAKEEESVNRFKLRVRTYGDPAKAKKVFMEIKRKQRAVVVKSRTTVSSDRFNKELFAIRSEAIPFRNDTEQYSYYEFLRLRNAIGATPQLLVKYKRESYFGVNDHYARLTFDRQICYQPTREWSLVPPGKRWWSIDSCTALNRPFAGVILELKTFEDVPSWMVDLVRTFNLVRIGFCKYAAAVRMESLFSGNAFSEASDSISQG